MQGKGIEKKIFDKRQKLDIKQPNNYCVQMDLFKSPIVNGFRNYIHPYLFIATGVTTYRLILQNFC